MRRTPPLNALRAFEAAARHGSFALAAGELNVTAAAVSHRIKTLEQALGAALFERRARGVAVTEAGRRYRDQVAYALSLIDRATAEIDHETVDGPLTVSMPHSLATHWLLPRLGELRSRYPGLQLQIDAGSTPVDFRHGQADAAIRFGPGAWEDLDSVFLCGDAVTVLMPAGCLGGRADARPATMLREATLLTDAGVTRAEEWMTWTPWLRRAGLLDDEPQARLTFNDSGLVLRACLHGDGACIARLSIAADALQCRDLLPLFPWRPTAYAYYFVSRFADRDNPRIVAFRKWLTGAMRAFASDVLDAHSVDLLAP